MTISHQLSASGRWRIHAAVVALSAVFLAAHLPFLPTSLVDLDSINFALGVRHFDVANHQPHPPGYPVFIAAAKLTRLVVPSEAVALALLSTLAGALSVVALFALFRVIDPGPRKDRWSLAATVVTVTAPLYWLTAARPLSDMPGLAAALAAQAVTLSATNGTGIALAGFLAAFAVGLRSQVVWLTVPLLILTIARLPAPVRLRVAANTAGAFTVGALAWALPLAVLSGGVQAYWRALLNQGTEDLTGVRMLWTTPTLQQGVLALDRVFIAPWAITLVAAIVIVFAARGAVRLFRVAPASLVTLAVAFAPYVVFDLLFQETATTRYSLPILPPIAYLAVRAGSRLERGWTAALALLAVVNLGTAAPTLLAYSRSEPPVTRLLADMREHAAVSPPESAPVLAMHQREDRPLAWVAERLPPFSGRLPAPPKHEWLEMVKYWNDGGQADVWFVANPLRTDLALIDHASRHATPYRWTLPHRALVGGTRPDAMDWHRIRLPGWYLGEGWALTPETAGVAAGDARGPGRAPIRGWIRRRPEATTLMVGGRNLSAAGPAARIVVAIDGRTVDATTVAPGFFLRMLTLPAGSLDGSSVYAPITVSADQPMVAIEQFDVQSADRLVFGFGDGWHEREYNPTTGRQWHWTSDRATLRVHGVHRPLVLRLVGDPPSVMFSKPSLVKISAGGHEVASETLFARFDLQVRIPAELVADDDSTITIETDQVVVPGEQNPRSPDRRRLGLQVFECDLRPAY